MGAGVSSVDEKSGAEEFGVEMIAAGSSNGAQVLGGAEERTSAEERTKAAKSGGT